MTNEAGPETLHASCVVLGEAGILIRGPSGSGKSTLARRLVEAGGASGRFARLVADDRTRLAVASGRLVARPAAGVAGLIEFRGIGLCRVPHEPACVIGLVVDLVPDHDIVRFPASEDATACLMGVHLPRIAVTPAHAAESVLWRLRGQDDTEVTVL